MTSAQKVAAAGRFGDVMLARLSKSQAKLLKDMGGSGTTNPETGLPEFFDFSSFAGAIAAPIAGSVVSSFLNSGTSKAQKNAANAAAANTELQTKMAQRMWALGDEAYNALGSAYSTLLDSPGFGSWGRFDLGAMGNYVQDRSGMMASGRQALERGMATALGGAQSVADRNMAGYMGRMADPYAQVGASLMGHGNAINYAQQNGQFVDGRYAGQVNSLANDLALRMQRETDRSLQDAFGDVEASTARDGMGRSTYDLEARKAFADGAARRRNMDVIQALEGALQLIGQQQQLDMNATNMDRDLAELLGGLYSQNNTMARGMLSDAMRMSELDQALRGTEYEQFFRNRALGRGDYTDSQTGYVDDYGTLWTDAFARWANMQGLRGNTISEVSDLITSPYAAAAGMFDSAGRLSGSAAQTGAYQAAQLGSQLGSAAQGFGNIFQRAWFEGMGKGAS